MKRTISILVMTFVLSLFANAQPRALSVLEISQSKTPESVAWNFIMSIASGNYQKMEILLSPYLKNELQQCLEENKLTYSTYFTDKYSNEFSEMCSLINTEPQKYLLAITDAKTIAVDEKYGNESPDQMGYSVSFDCTDIYGNIYSGNQDSDACVVLVFVNDAWRVAYYE